MGLYNVIRPCVAGIVQFVRPTPEFQPVEIDDADAAPGVEDGSLTPYLPELAEHQKPHVHVAVGDSKADDGEQPKPKARSRSRADED